MKFKSTAILLAIGALASVSVAHMTTDLTSEDPAQEHAAAASPVEATQDPLINSRVTETIVPEIKSPMAQAEVIKKEDPVIAISEKPPVIADSPAFKLPPPPPGVKGVVATQETAPANAVKTASSIAASSTSESVSASSVTSDKSGVAMSSDILFGFNGTSVGPDARVLLDRLLPRLKAMDLEIVLATGHADRIGSDKVNDTVALRRANAVRDYLVSHGIPSSKVRVESKGSQEPISSGCEGKSGATLRECYAPDRRVNITAQGFGTAGAMPAPTSKAATTSTRQVDANTVFTVYFEGSSIQLKSTDNDLLDEIADAAMEAQKVYLHGRSAIGDSEQRKARAIARGWAVRQGLVFRGVEKEDIRIFYRTKGLNLKENNERVDVQLIPKAEAGGKAS